MLTPSQKSLYWREWASVCGYCKSNGLPQPDRHVLHAKALGGDKSSKDFDNDDLDKFLAACRAIYRPDNLNAQIRQVNQPRTRTLWKLENVYFAELAQLLCQDNPEQAALRAELYVVKILRSKYHCARFDGIVLLKDHDLQNLCRDLARCIAGLRKKHLTSPDDQRKRMAVATI